MEELNIVINQSKGEITTNFKELKEKLKEQLEPYKNLTVSEDEISFAKADLAYLRKQRTEVENRRKAVKKAYCEPLDKFEDSCKELTGIFDEAIQNINDQLTLFEQDRIAKKRERITELYKEKVGDFLEFLPIEKNYNEKWNNKSYSDSDIEFDISGMVLKIRNDIDVIKSLNSEIENELINVYKIADNNLASAITRNQQYLSDKQRVAEQAKAEAERKAQEEAERKAREEAEKAQNVEEPIQKEVENVEESVENGFQNVDEAPFKESPLAGTTLDAIVQMTKTVKIIISADDLEQVEQTLKFMEISYQVVEE